ncbi:hypothetical protein ACEPAF_5988 [Sanghuangporus sanghuang]
MAFTGTDADMSSRRSTRPRNRNAHLQTNPQNEERSTRVIDDASQSPNDFSVENIALPLYILSTKEIFVLITRVLSFCRSVVNDILRSSTPSTLCSSGSPTTVTAVTDSPVTVVRAPHNILDSDATVREHDYAKIMSESQILNICSTPMNDQASTPIDPKTDRRLLHQVLYSVRVNKKDYTYDADMLDPALANWIPFYQSLPPLLFLRAWNGYNPSYDGVFVSVYLEHEMQDRLLSEKCKCSVELLHQLYSWSGFEPTINYITIDPFRITSKKVGSANYCAAVGRSRDDPEHSLTPPCLAQFVTVGVVSAASITQVDNNKKCKYVTLQLPSVFADRLQSLCYVAFEQILRPYCAQISLNGLDFQTRRE